MAFVDPSRDFADGTLVFSAGADMRVPGFTQLPHAWLLGSRIYPHIHFVVSNTAAGNIRFTFEYKWARINGEFQSDYTLVTVDRAAPASTLRHNVQGFGFIDMTGGGVSTIVQWRFARLGAQAEDTYAGNVKLLYIDTHIQIDGLGSDLEYEKF